MRHSQTSKFSSVQRAFTSSYFWRPLSFEGQSFSRFFFLKKASGLWHIYFTSETTSESTQSPRGSCVPALLLTSGGGVALVAFLRSAYVAKDERVPKSITTIFLQEYYYLHTKLLEIINDLSIGFPINNIISLHTKILFWKQISTIGSYTSKKVHLRRGGPCFFSYFISWW